MKHYPTTEVATLTGLAPARIRAWARSGLLDPDRGPGRRYRFSFQDLVLLRTAAGLEDAGIPGRRIRAALDRLRARLPRGRSLAQLRIAAEGDRVVVHDGRAAWNPESGQYHLDFTVAELGARVAPLAVGAARAAADADEALDADGWYELGLDLEAYAPGEAREAYERAIALGPDHADARVNLGRILHDAGDAASAEVHYRAAVDTGPHPTAAYNLGVAVEDQGRLEEAARWYRRAIGWDPDLVDAHYNLAMVLEKRGDQPGALRHLAACKRIVEARRGRRADH